MEDDKRVMVDCRDYPSGINCSLAISGKPEEVLEAAVAHAVSVHGEKDSAKLREEIKSMFKEENLVSSKVDQSDIISL